MSAIPHANHRYPTIGDFWEHHTGSLTHTHFRVSEELSPKHRFLVLLHEFIEANIAQFREISFDDIDAFDVAFETQYPNNTMEPGEQLDAPYHKEHMFAELIERLVANEIGVEWIDYTAAQVALINKATTTKFKRRAE